MAQSQLSPGTVLGLSWDRPETDVGTETKTENETVSIKKRFWTQIGRDF